MIDILKMDNSEPFAQFRELYQKATRNNQSAIEAVAISSYSNITKEVDSRFVNLKYVIGRKLIFFTNYLGPKGTQFKENPSISALIYWDKIDTQIRIKANIYKCSAKFSDEHFKNRSPKKNALAIASNQSQKIKTYDEVVKKYNNTLNSDCDFSVRPNYWGGYAFEPYYFEFWIGNESRINKRNAYILRNNDLWSHSILEP